ncbi:hypothetical protein ACA910_005275 [Epithemia clementina (nom. ined.)]
MLVFLKPTDALIWGPGDIIGVEIATIRFPNGSEDKTSTSYRMGLYYCVTGLGVFVGPTLANYMSDAARPASLQRSCCIAIFITMTGWIMAALSPTFNWYLLASWWSGLGYGTLWAYSSLLLQILIDERRLGRVLSIEFFFFVIAEALSSSVTGPLYDFGFSTNQLCLVGAVLAMVSLLFWSTFHVCGGGAAHPRFNQQRLSSSPKDESIPSFIELSILKRPKHEEDEDVSTTRSQGKVSDAMSESGMTRSDDEKSVSRRKSHAARKADESKTAYQVSSITILEKV